MRNSLSNLLRHSIRTTFRVLMQIHGATWKDMTQAEKIRWRNKVEQFYLSRETSDDLDWTTVREDNTFTEGPLQGLSLAIFRLDFNRVARLRITAARIRCGWTLHQQEKWKRERTEAETEDDFAFGFESQEQHRFAGWVPQEPACQWTHNDVVEVISSDSEEQQQWGDDEQSAASTCGDSSQWSWRPAAADSAEAAWSWPEWRSTASTARTSTERWDAGQPQSESRGCWHSSRSIPVGPPPGLEREENILPHLDMLQDEHLWLPPAWRWESLSSRSVLEAPQYTPLLNQGRFCWDHMANHAEPHVRRTFGRNPVEYAKGKGDAPWKKWSFAEVQLERGRVTSCDTAISKVLSWMILRPSLWNRFDFMVAHYDLEPLGIDMGGLPGLWLQFTIKDRPQPHKTRLDATRRFGYHGTSMYCIARIFKQDTLVTGMAHLTINDKELFGVYYHSNERAHLCQGTYMHYIGFGGGWYVAPLIVLDTLVQCKASDGSNLQSVAHRSTKSQTQYITYENQHQLDGMFLHFIHASQVRRMPRNTGILAEPGWVPQLELDVTETWEKVQERSSSLRNVPPGI
jgi:hypothetical protein